MNRIHLAAAASLLAAPFLAGGALAQPTTPVITVPPGSTVQVPPGGSVEVLPGGAVQATPGGVQMTPGSAVQVNPTPRGNTRVGQLECSVAGGVGFVFGSSRDLECEFRPANGPLERYRGEIRRFGVDIGVTGRATMIWSVFNTGSDIRPGSLSGTYVGASTAIAVGLGLGSNLLIGGSNDQVALQPLSIEGGTGLNVAAGIGEVTLRPAG
ncbi:DUF992 domain-containing protein [Muricoccus radiodurans]|uniref:DUF992 domain-containing protein n=1 Tax=Muricoccus radiodurans TaxID=2231721 RepID=UPI003CF0FBF1